VESEKLKVGEVTLPCVVVRKDRTETWYCTWLPGDGVAKVVEEGKLMRVVTDAGLEKDKSILMPCEPEKWKAAGK
jgi:hypothetical protein